jgi:hypothetical protein
MSPSSDERGLLTELDSKPRSIDYPKNEVEHFDMVVVREVDSPEWTAIEQLVERLKQSYPHLPIETVTQVVHQHHAKFDGRPVRDFVPLFVERGSRRVLAGLGA